MPDKITVKINVDAANQTVSKFAIEEGGHVTFQNDASAVAKVTFKDVNPLCKGNSPDPTIELDPGDRISYKFCKGTDGQQFKYTATVDGAASEDPIFIIEKKSAATLDIATATALGIGIVVGAIAGYLIAKRSRQKVQEAR